MDPTIVNHHEQTPFGIIVLELFKIQVIGGRFFIFF